MPFKERSLTVRFDPTSKPQSTHECMRINYFSMGETNPEETPELFLWYVNSSTAIQKTTERLQEWYNKAGPNPRDLASALALRREYLLNRAFVIAQSDHFGPASRGRKVWVENSGREPSWRKMLRVENILWISGHDIEYAIRQVVIEAAMDLNNEGELTEVVVTLRTSNGGSLSSLPATAINIWMKDCSGQVTFGLD
ncbi:KR domain-containing protein [Trichoderma harzianum]|uniref:KR domain-containing protein n=1 Tax=Trichoderma harzianum TaxID=5544 RepID=A0A0F9XRJ6_TRIHA|nr:KR domain-containing protein [Trichoderma harzianum]